ncbi:MAG: response regulator [Myxococcota bacterium]|nr:response regulator [Deltaproteobacteria bacterium]MDQ3336398.1 response regulator [Myxococcota bacterium]
MVVKHDSVEESMPDDPPRLARGTEPVVKVRLKEPAPSLAASDIANTSAALKSSVTDVLLEFCLLEAMSPTAGDIDRALTRISSSMQELDRIANELADVAALMQDRLILSKRSNEIRSLILEVIDRTIATRDRGRVFIEAPPACLALVDAPRLERVVTAFVKHALAASPADRGIVIRLEAHEDATVISVIDGGRGMSEHEASTLFEPGEDGIGMYLCRRIVEAHGGRVGVESHFTGTRRFIELPVASRARVRALLVDDDARQREGLAELLRRAGIAVTLADCGSMALQHAAVQTFDVALVDLELPDVSGSELVAQLRARRPKLSIIVVSGHPADSDAVRSLDACDARYLEKPLDIEALLAEITHCTAKR